MNRFYVLFCLVAGLFLFNGANAQSSYSGEDIPGKLVFKIKPAYKSAAANIQSFEKLNQALAAINATGLVQKFPKAAVVEGNPEAVDLTLIYQVNISPALHAEKARQALLKTGLLEYAEPLRSFPPLYRPNDPFADSTTTGYQFHLKNTRTYRGWDFSKGDTSIVIGILDTGVRLNHRDLKDNIKYNYADPIDGVDNDNDGYTDNFRGWDVADNDNTPSADLDGHGVFVAGVASAKTDNGKGIAGVGFKCKFLPVKIYRSLASGSFGGYEGIVYAADHGCSVINLSWGGASSPSAFEQDVINYAVINKNVVVIGAAGNTNAKLDFYPASYKNVLSVGSLKASGQKGSSHTFSYLIDLSAPGENIRTTGNASDSAYTSNVSGTSFSAPQVAGAAGLVKHKFPNYNAQQIAEQLRTTANPVIYTLPANAPYTDRLGKGILDVAKALTVTNAKSVRFTGMAVNKGELLYPGDTIEIQLTLKNYLEPLTNLQVNLTSPSAFVTILQPAFAAGAMATLATKTTTQPFRVIIQPAIPVNEKVALKFSFTDGAYSDYQYAELIMNPDFVTLDVNKLAVTINSFGNIGFNGVGYSMGNGIRYEKMNLLSMGGFMVGNAATTVSDNVFKSGNTLDNDFTKLVAARFVSAPYADQEIRAEMKDLYPDPNMVGVKVKYRAFAWQFAPRDKFIILEYKVSNNQTATLTGLHAGLFADWDILDGNKNVVNWNAANKMGYVYNVPYDTLYAGIKLLTTGAPSYYALDLFNPPAGTVNIIDGFTDAEKYQTLSGGVARANAGSTAFGNDVAHVIGSALPDLAPNDSTVIAFAIIAGDNLAQLQASAVTAQTAYTQLITNSAKERTAGSLQLYPNPVTETLWLTLPETTTPAEIEIRNITGQVISRHSKKQGGTVGVSVKELPAGLYLLQVKDGYRFYTRKFQVVK